MNNIGITASVSAIIGLVLPAVVELVNAKIVNTYVKFFVALVVSGLAALVSAYSGGQITGVTFLTALGIVFPISQTIYKTYWNGSTPQAGMIAAFKGSPEPVEPDETQPKV